MNKLTLLCLAGLCVALVGCGDPLKSANDKPKDPEASTESPAASQQGSQGGVAPMAGVGGGAMAPVSGSETVTGSGGGSVGMAAKGKARDVANSAPSSVNQMGEDGN